MRVVGYVREIPGPETEATAFMQAERVRRWVARNAYQLVAICQDGGSPGDPASRNGYRALLGIIAAQQADIVVVPALQALSVDKITQEIMLWDLRTRGVAVVATEEADIAALAEPPADPARLLVRDVLHKYAQYRVLLGSGPAAQRPFPTEQPVDDDVLIELVPVEEEQPPRREAAAS